MAYPRGDLVFFSYSHRDKKWLDRLLTILKPWQLNVWADPYIEMGDRWRREIGDALGRTGVAVFLVSPDFLASDFIDEEELPPLLEAAEEGEVVVACVPVGYTAVEVTPFKEYQWARNPEQPLEELDKRHRNRALIEIARKIVAAVPEEAPAEEAPAKEHLEFSLAEKTAAVAVVPGDVLGALHGVPKQRPHFLPRKDDLRSLRQALLGEVHKAVGLTGSMHKVGLHGMGGIGKTVLTIALAEDEDVRRAFPDGIYWITLSQQPDLPRLQADLIAGLGGEAPAASNLELGRNTLRALLADKACLLILDDLWQTDHATAFDALGPRSRLLMTTRDAGLITALGAREERLDVLSQPLALDLLADWTGQARDALPEVAAQVAEACGRLPLALSLAAAQVRDGMAWEDLLAALQAGDLEFLDHPYGSIFTSMRLSVDALPDADAARYLELAVYPEDVHIPEATVRTLWRHTGGLKDYQVSGLLSRLERKGLLYRSDDEQVPGLNFHDLQHDYLRLAVDDLPALHATLLDAYREGLAGRTAWHTLPDEAAYLWTHLAYHLAEVGLHDELAAAVKDLRYLAKKTFLFGPRTAEADVRQAAAAAPADDALAALGRSLAQAAHLLTDSERLDDLAATLFSRLDGVAALETATTAFQADFDAPHLQPTWPLPDQPDALLRVLEGHTDSVLGCAVDPQDRRIVSASDDKTLRVWDAETGAVLHVLEGHTSSVNGCAVDPQGRRIVSASRDGTLRVWDAETGAVLRVLEGHTSSVNGCAVDPQGRWIVSASSDKTLRVWDAETGAVLHVLEGHTDSVNGCAVDPQGRWIVSASRDGTLRVWDAETGVLLRVFEGHTGWVLGCAVDPQGRWIVSASRDGTLRVWEAATGRCLAVLRVDGELSDCAWLPDGQRIVAVGVRGVYVFEFVAEPGADFRL